jgi:4'-phosphopantetheinyl transferase
LSTKNAAVAGAAVSCDFAVISDSTVLSGDRLNVEIWHVALTDPAARHVIGTLNETERARAGLFSTPMLQMQYIAARGALRNILATYLGCDPASVPLGNRPCPSCGEPHGKPIVEGDWPCFNLSHAARHAVVAIADDDVGVDLEPRSRAAVIQGLGRMFSNSDELPADDAALLETWTQKEAILKAAGIGIATGAMTEIEFVRSGVWRFSEKLWYADAIAELPRPYIGHVAGRRPITSVAARSWSPARSVNLRNL